MKSPEARRMLFELDDDEESGVSNFDNDSVDSDKGNK